jgi:hypothetical protein
MAAWAGGDRGAIDDMTPFGSFIATEGGPATANYGGDKGHSHTRRTNVLVHFIRFNAASAS